MDAKKKLATLQAEASALRVKINDGSMTEVDRKRATEIANEADVLRKRIADDEDLTTQLNAAAAASGYTTRTGDGQEIAVGGPIGSTAGFTRKVMGAFKAAADTIGGPAVGKALVPAGAIVAGFDGRIIHDPQAAHSLLSAVAVEQTDSAAGTYLQQVLRESNASTVANGDLKPLSRYALEPRTWRVATIATVTQGIQRQHLADYEALQAFLAAELAYGVNDELERFIVEGGVDEDGNPVTGVLTTSGVFQTAHTTNALLSIRRALRECEELGTVPTGIAVTPADWEALDTLQLTDNGFLLAGAPTSAPIRTLWNIPVTVTNALPVGTALVGNLKAITLRYRNSLELTWSEAPLDVGTAGAPELVDLWRRNQIAFRAEVRAALEVTSVKDLRVVELTAPAGA